VAAIEAAERAEGLQRKGGIQRGDPEAAAAAAAAEAAAAAAEAAAAAARGGCPTEAPARTPCRHCGRGFSTAARLAAHERVCAQAAARGFRAQVNGLEQMEHEGAQLHAEAEARRAREREVEAAQAHSLHTTFRAEPKPTPDPEHLRPLSPTSN